MHVVYALLRPATVFYCFKGSELYFKIVAKEHVALVPGLGKEAVLSTRAANFPNLVSMHPLLEILVIPGLHALFVGILVSMPPFLGILVSIHRP